MTEPGVVGLYSCMARTARDTSKSSGFLGDDRVQKLSRYIKTATRSALGNIGSSWVSKGSDSENVASSCQERSCTNVMRQANDMRPWRPSEDTKMIEVLLRPDFLEPGKAGLRTADDIFMRDGNAFDIRNGRSRRCVQV